MPPTVDIADPGIRLSSLVHRAAQGEEIVIVCNGIPSARILPAHPPLEHTIDMIIKERDRRQPSSTADNLAARDHGRR